MRAKEFITEVFDSKIEYHTEPDPYTFKTTLLMSPTREIVLFAEEEEPGTWIVEFYQYNPKTHRFTYHQTGDKEEFKVFGFVLKSLVQLIETRQPEIIKFSSGKEDRSRSNLYSRLIGRYADKLGYDLKELRSAGDSDFFTLVKKDNTISEAPLPAEWDKSKFGPATPGGEIDFNRMADYAKARAKKLGIGSSRVALLVPYQGRDTALKVAINEAGVAQNKAESEMLLTPWVQNSGMVIPIIPEGFDKNNPEPTWIHCELAQPFLDQDEEDWFVNVRFIAYWLTNPEKHDTILKNMKSTWSMKYSEAQIAKKIDIFSQYVDFVLKLSKEFDLKVNDLRYTENWGMYKGKPVIIDLGFTDAVWLNYYKRRQYAS